ncbi:phage minor head protein [Paenibacillus sp. sgz302251]|uniref:phage minor head protein n=1 Tax=Paenibacillus sp. sgz302251 TaxID=3414493 RepID=UPI003C7E18B6
MQEINDKFAEADKLSEKLISSTEKELVKQYSLSLKNIRSQLQAIYEKFGDDVSFADMQKFNRFNSLEKAIMDEIKFLYKANAKALNESLFEQFAESYYRTAFALETGKQVALAYTLLNPDVIKAAIINPVSGLTLPERLEKNRTDIIYRIKSDIAQGLIQGEGYSKMAKRVKETLEGDVSKAIRVVQTEAHRVQQEGRLQSMKHAESKGVNMVKVWDASLDSRTRSSHRKLDGVKVGLDDDFTSPSGGKGKIPGSLGSAKDDVNCRCSVRTEIISYEPTVRRARDERGKSVLIPYTTYDEWEKNRL